LKANVKSVIVLGGGVIGWFTAATIKKQHPNYEVTLIESPYVPTLGVGESTVPPLVKILSTLGIDENTWLKGVHGIHKFGNHFVGWNTEKPMLHVTDHWNADKKDYTFHSFSYSYRSKALRNNFYKGLDERDLKYGNDERFGVDEKSYDYWLYLVKQGKYSKDDTDAYTMEQYHPAMANRAAKYMDGYPVTGEVESYAWHVDAERYPKMIRDLAALPLGVKWIKGHVEHVELDDDGYVDKLIFKDGREFKADLFCDCTGLSRILMKKMENEWVKFNHLPTQSAWVAPVKYKDPYKEMKPYTQSYAQKAGWNFIITLYSRMGSGYVFDANSEDPDVAREDYIKYWDGYDFIRDPKLIQWEQGHYKKTWTKNVVGIGMGQGFTDPMEATTLFHAQVGITLLNQILDKYDGRIIPKLAKQALGRHVQKMLNQAANFISYHYTISKRRDTPFWKKWGQFGIDHDHVTKNWNEYKNPANYFTKNNFLDYQWAHQQLYLDQWDDALCKIDDIDPNLVKLAEVDFNYLHDKGKAIANTAPHVYDWTRKLHDGATHSEILEQALAERSDP